MIRRTLAALLLVTFAHSSSFSQSVIGTQKTAPPAPVVVPFEFVTRHILIKVRINNSAPLSFILDTGDKVAIVDIGKAKSLGLTLEGSVNVGGAGAGTLKGSMVRDASLSVVGLDGITQPVVMAIPLDGLAPRFGHAIDGIIGADFIGQFVLEIDYPGRVIRLYDKAKFEYSGSGETIPLTFIYGGYPVISSDILIAGRQPIKGRFVVDIGSGASLALHRPFVEQEGLLAATPRTIRAIGTGGAGGKVTGRSGRIAGIKIGRFQIDNLPTLFSEDNTGAFANSELQGNIGALILSKFKVIFDYSRARMILEPNASLPDLILPAGSGLRIIAEGADYKTYRIDELLEESPATEAGFQTGDVVLTVDGRPATEFTLTSLHELLEKPSTRKISVRRGERTLDITLTPRRLI
jgi:Aspartyl protease/PDZ domain